MRNLAVVKTVSPIGADSFSAVVVQNFDGVAVEDGMMGPEKSLAKAGSCNYTHEQASWSAHTKSSTFVHWVLSAPTNIRLFGVILYDDEETLP